MGHHADVVALVSALELHGDGLGRRARHTNLVERRRLILPAYLALLHRRDGHLGVRLKRAAGKGQAMSSFSMVPPVAGTVC